MLSNQQLFYSIGGLVPTLLAKMQFQLSMKSFMIKKLLVLKMLQDGMNYVENQHQSNMTNIIHSIGSIVKNTQFFNNLTGLSIKIILYPEILIISECKE